MTVTNVVTIKDKAAVGGAMHVNGYMTLTGTYATNGFTLTPAQLGLHQVDTVDIEEQNGVAFNYIASTGKVKAYRVPAVTGTVALSGSTAAGSSHTHAVALDSGTSAATSHTHGLTLAASAAGTNHTHAWTPGGNTDAGAAHTHAFTGTAVATSLFTVSHDATPETSVLYINTFNFVDGFLSSDNSADNASDYFADADGGRYTVIDDNGAAVVATAGRFQVYFDEDAANADSRFLINNTITATDLFVKGSGGKLIRFVHNANAAVDGVAVYFNDDGADATLRVNGTLPSAANVTTNTTDDTYKGLVGVCAGSNANESTHTHAVTAVTGTNADENAHTHALTGTTVDAETAHTHGPGTLADVASGAEAVHTHAATGLSATLTGAAQAAMAEVTNGTDMSSFTIIYFEAVGK